MAKKSRKTDAKQTKPRRRGGNRVPRPSLSTGPDLQDVEFAAQSFARTAVNAMPDVKDRRAQIQRMLINLVKKTK